MEVGPGWKYPKEFSKPLRRTQDRQEIKEGTKFKKELRITKISEIDGGFLMGREKDLTCHRIPHLQPNERDLQGCRYRGFGGPSFFDGRRYSMISGN
jgi:hypothetical protein